MKIKHQITALQRKLQRRGGGERGRGGESPPHHSLLTTHHSLSAAFTLVEVLIVVVILAILASVLLPVIGDPATSRLRGAATILTRDIQYVQAEAMNTGQTL